MTRKLYTINELTALFAVPASTVRYWESEFSSYLAPERDSRNRRLYTESDLAMFRKIHHLLSVEKYTIAGAREKLSGLNLMKEKLATVLKSALFELEHGVNLNAVIDKCLAELN